MATLNQTAPALAAPRTRPVVLIFTAFYLPAYKGGGPIRSLSNMVAALGDQYDFKILTSDRDLGDERPFPNVPIGEWTRVGQADVLYTQPGLSWIPRCRSIMRAIRPDLIYINSFFGRRFSIAPATVWRLWRGGDRPGLLLAPRGEFSQGAMRSKTWRKRAFIHICRRMGLHTAVLWHASSPFEAEDIHRELGSAEPIAVAGPLGPGRKNRVLTALDVPERPTGGTAAFPAKPCGTLKLVFLSRIVPKKNLDGALRIVKTLRGQVTFKIYGPAEDAQYWRKCQASIAEMPSNITVEYAGVIDHDRVHEALRSSDVFLFPTLGENFGHVILEALSAGCLPVISDQTAWRDLASKRVGWDLPLSDLEGFRKVLQECIDMPEEQFLEFRNRAAAFGAHASMDPRIIEQNRHLLQEALSRYGSLAYTT